MRRIKATNYIIEDAFLHLQRWTPRFKEGDANVTKEDWSHFFETRLQLNKNLKTLKRRFNEKENQRAYLANSHITDQNRAPRNDGSVHLTPQELLKFNPEYEKLMNMEQDCGIYPIEVFSSKAGHKPVNPKAAIDLDKVEVPDAVMAALLGVVFFRAEELLVQDVADTWDSQVESPKSLDGDKS